MTRHLASMSALTALLLALSACTTSSTAGGMADPMHVPPDMFPNCGAGMLRAYIGHKATPDVVAGLREWRGESPVRVLRPNMAVTMDYRPDRLNIVVDEGNVIRKFTCT